MDYDDNARVNNNTGKIKMNYITAAHTIDGYKVSHGIFAKGLNGLNEYYDAIYTHNLFTPIDGVTILE